MGDDLSPRSFDDGMDGRLWGKLAGGRIYE